MRMMSTLPSESDLRDLLVTRLAARLGVDPSAIDPRESFQSHGLDSSGSVGFIADLSAALGRTLSPTLIWAHPTPEALARFLAGGDSAPARVARSTAADEPIAVVGMACRFPGASDLEAFWHLLSSGIDATREVPAERWDPAGFYDPDPETPGTTNTRRGAFLERIDEFDPLFFGISPREAAEMDPQQRIMLELSWEALEDAGLPPRDLAGTKTGVFTGVVWRDYAELHRAAGAPVTSHTGVGQGVTIVANRVSYALGLRGPSLVVDTACSSSLVAVHLACQSLRTGESTLALAGGVNLTLLPQTMVALTKFGGLSGEGRCKAFDASADGFARGEGAGVVVLKALSRALADGDPIYCVIRGSAVNNDGASNGLTAPNPESQVEVLRDAYERAGVDPGRVQVVEAHGTGTPLGDPIEARALSRVLGEGRTPDHPLVIGSVKTNIGHLEGAAGVAGLIKLALSIYHRTVPPSLHFERPNPDIPFAELGLRVQTALGPWPLLADGEKALGGVSSFGWGGTNCHLVVEGGEEGTRTVKDGQGRIRTDREASRRPVFVFSGIGAQWPGMGVDLLRSEPVFRARLEACDRVLAPLTGWSVVEELIAGGPGERVERAVPAIFAVEVALAALWRSWGVEPGAVIGHSAGELAAAHVAGRLSLEDAALGAFHYSRLLARIAGRVGLGVVQLPAEEVAARIANEGDRLAVAGWSSPSSTLVAGEPEPLDRLLAAVAAEGRFSARVQSDVASHCPRVEPLMDELRQSLGGIAPRRGRIEMISTVTGEPVRQPLDALYWTANLRQPVRFSQAVEHALRAGFDTFLEVDPHPILTTPLEQCFAAFGNRATVLPSIRRREDAQTVLARSLEALNPSPREAGSTILPLSARSAEARREMALRTAVRLRSEGTETAGDFGWTAALRRGHHEHRVAVVGRSRAELAERLEAFAAGELAAGVAAGRAGRGDRRGIVFAFSGQGPQWFGMGRQLMDAEPVFRDAMERCDEAFRPWLGGSLMDSLDDEEDALDRTELAQPAIFALQVGLTELWRSWGVTPTAVVGHSVGEIAAAWASGVLTLDEAARVAAVRGGAMAGARRRGGMIAAALGEAEARGLLADLRSSLEIAAVNGPSSVTLGGAPEDLDAAMAELTRRGATGRRLRVGYAFHTVQMEPFDAEVEAALFDLRPRFAAMPLISTVTGSLLEGPEMDGSYWRTNVRQPVRFGDAVASLAAAGHTAFLEIGPHPVLAASIAEAIDPSATVLASLRRGRDERETLLESLGALYVLGWPVDWRGVFPDGGRRAPLPSYPFQRQRYWFSAPSRPAAVAAPSVLPETHLMPASSHRARLTSTLQGIFGRVLRIEPARIDIEAPFLELGADSLSLVEALRGIQEAYGVKLTIRQLFERLPSISALAAFLEGQTPPPEPVAPVVAEPPEGSALERVLAMQMAAFHQLVAQQLQALGGPPGPVQPSQPSPAKGFWERQGKPAIAPVRVDRTDPPGPTDRSDTTAEYAARGMAFSLYFFGHYPAQFRAGKYDLLFEAARYGDRHGFSALWFPERHFHPFGGLSPNPSVLAAALARETERIALRAGSVVLPLHHPLRVAEEWSLVDNLSGGRVGLSYASGWHPNDFALAPEAYGRHRDLMFERIEEVRRLWRGEALRVRDGAGKEVDVRIYPRPARRELAEWITIVNNPDTWRRAGEMGVGVLTNLMGQTVEGLTGMVRIYREALAAAGHPPEKGHVTLLLHTFLDADPALAVERARRPFYDYLKSSVGLLQNMMASEGITADFDRMAEEDLEYMLEMAFQRYVATSALIGSPDSCAPIVERLRAVGVDEIACLIDFGVEPALVMAGLPALAELKDRFAEMWADSGPAPEPISFPLTEAQSDLYTVALAGDEALGAYYESGVLELRGPLDLGLLRQALQSEVDRHEALRTMFPPMGEAQVILPALRLEVPLLDAAGWPSERREEIAGSWLEALARDPFDLAHGPLVRASALRLGERHHLLSFAVHHLVADGLSIGILLGEVFAAYEAMRAGCRPALPRPMQFREYAAWLAEAWTAERLAGDEAYWLSELAGDVPGNLPVFEPPTDRPRPPVFTFRGRRQRIVLAAADRERIQRFGRRHGATLFMTLLAAWTALLHRWTGQDDVIAGSAQARRPLEGGDRLVGHCTDIVPLRSRLAGEGAEPTFPRHLAAVRGRVLGAHDHGELSFSRLVRRLEPRRDPSRSPLVNVIFNLDPEWAIGPAGGLEIVERSPAMPFVKFDLAAHAVPAGERLVIYLDSRRDLFDAATIERLAGRFVALLEGAMENPGLPLEELPWMTAADRAQLVAEALVPYPRERTVHELFAEVAAERPDAVAVEAGDRRLTYAELDAFASTWAHRLRALGVGTDSRVATVLERSPELIAAWLAALKAGGAYVPLDPGFPEERLARLLTGSGAVVVLTVEEHREKVERALAQAGLNLPVLLLTSPSSPDEGLAGEEGRGDEGLGLAYVTYTSGSTGEPKGVAIPHRAVVRLARETDYARLGPDDRVAHLAHVAFDATTFEIWGPLLNGGRVVVLDRDTAVSPRRLAAALRERGVTALFLTTALFNRMAIEEPAAFAGLRCVLTGGEAADPARFRDVLAAGAPGRLVNIYGPTECTTFALWEPVEDLPAGAAGGRLSIPIGRPIANTRVCILRGCDPVSAGLDGELCLGGDGLARGYLGRPDLTAERFVPDPISTTPGERLYRTGDRARMRPDGRVEYHGRLDRQVKIRGFRIEPGEVEAALAAYPGLREVVVGVSEDRWGESRLTAWFVPGGGSPPKDRDLRGFLAARLPAAMIPAVFLGVPSLPLTASGKIDRSALAALRSEPVTAAQPVKIPTPAGPLTPTTEVLRGLWADVLGREQVGPDDDFFALGGHSLLATRVLLRVRSLLGPDLPMHVLLDLPTPALFAARIDRELAGGAGSGPEPGPLSDAIPLEHRAPLSFAQERLWFFSRLAPGSIAYNLPSAFHLTGPLIPDALAAALGEIVRRHEALRTVFAEGEEGEPEQVVRAFTGFAVPRVDLSALPDPRAAAESLTREEAQRPFDLGTGPLLRPFLLRLDGETHTLLLATHHILADGWSFGVLGRELAALYRAALAAEPSLLPPLPQLPIQYADFALWQRSWLQGEVLESLLDDWRRRLAGHPGVIELPTDRPRPPIQSFRGAIERLPFDAPGAAGELRDLLRHMGLRYRATPFMVALAALQVVLLHHTGEEDLLVGTPIAGRNRENIEGLIGFFVNTLPVRTNLGGDPSFTGLVARVREVTLAAYAQQDLPFDKLVEAFAPTRELSRNPLVQVVFAFQNTLLPDRHLAPGLACDVEYVDAGIAKFDLTFFLEEGGLSGGVEYATDLFDAATVRRLQGHFLNVARAAASAPDAAISELPILTPEERWQVVEAWNDTASEYPRETPVHRLFERVAARDPQAPAILWEGGALSYGELDRRANRLARRLRAQGVGPEVAVALDMERSPELVVASLAVLKAGGFYVPLDAADPAERRALILEDSGAAVRLGRDEVIEVTAAMAGEAGDAGEDSGPPSVAVDAEGLIYVIYTSGSTGRPKGVAVFHRAIARLVLSTDYVRLGPGERVAHVCNTAFDVAAFEMWGALLTGACLVVIPREVVLSPRALGEAYRRWGITVAFLTPPLFNEVMREAPETLAGVRQLLVGGEAVAPRWMREARAAAPRQRLLNAYGPTEATVFAAWHLVETVPEGASSVPIGLPIANTRLYVVDRHLRPVPVGVPGELCIAGDGLARGYLRRPDLTAERFVPDPFDRAGGRMYRTGDVARRLADGAIDYLGRTDAQVKVRSFRIELGEIEAALSRAPGVRECAVVVREQPEGGRLLVAWVALKEGAAADPRGFLRERLPDFMVPAVFAPLDAFPRTPSGKVDRRALARLEPPGGSGSDPGFEAPRTPAEQIVADVWSEVLGLQQVSVRESFFDLGGHSLLAGRVLRRLRAPLGVDLSLAQFFQHPTVAGLARLAGQARRTRRAGLPPLVRVAGAGPARLSFAQERLWLVDQLQPGSTAYNMALTLVLTGRLDAPALGRALEEIARRHEVLRTRFAAGDGGPVQIIEPASWLGLNPLSRVDLPGLPPELTRAELSRLGDLRQPFDLARGPLFRAVLVRASEAEHALMVEMHHSVCDGWSLDVMTRELSALYGVFAAGQPSPLPEPPIQYADFSRWQRQGLQGEVVEAELAWWRSRLGENPPPLALPTDRPRPAVPPPGGLRSESRFLTVPPDLADGLAALARSRGATLFIVLLAGFQALLHRHTHQPRILVGSPVAGRTRLEVEELIGLFVNTLVLAADFGGEPTAGVFLDQVRDATLGAFDHQDLPFEQLVAALARDRDPSRQPLFQVMFVLQNNAQSKIVLPGLNLAFLPGGGSTIALFDLMLSAVEVKGKVACGINYATELFDPATIGRFLEQYRRLLEALVENPGQLVGRLPLLSAAERHQLAVEWPSAAGQPPPLLHEGELVPIGVWGEAGRLRADGVFERRVETMAETSGPAKETLAEARRAELDRRRSEVASRRGQLSGDRRALLSKWVGGTAPVPGRPEEAPQPPPQPPAVTPLVKLHTSGTRQPIFLVHAAGGLVHDFVNLAQWLDSDQPFYALQSPALAGGEHFASVPEMAARYLEAVRSVQPRGPYRLGGYCIGGAVAFEMARQLRAAGEETGSLLLFDSPAPVSEPLPPLDEAKMLSSFVRSYGNAAEVSADELRALPPEAWIGHVLDRVRETGGLDPAFDAAQIHRRWEVMKRNTRAILPFVPDGRLPLGAILFRAVDQLKPYRSQPFLGWERWLEGPIEVVDVKGGHLDVFLEPAVEAVARELRDRTAVVGAV